MKFIKRSLAIVMAVCFGMALTTTVSVAEAEQVNYMNYDFPDDAVVLYQGEDGVIYQSKEKSTANKNLSLYSTNYASVWIDAGKFETGSFGIENPHTIINKTNGTFKIESNYSGATAQMILHDGIFTLANKTLSAADGDVHFEFNSHTRDLIITYYVNKVSKTDGMRLMCWLW